MAASANSSWKYCCTCEFWCGQRSSSDFGARIEYGHRAAEGECLEGSWDWRGQKRTALSTCTGWKKWVAVEEVKVA